MSVRSKLRREDGAAAVEFALIVGLLAPAGSAAPAPADDDDFGILDVDHARRPTYDAVVDSALFHLFGDNDGDGDTDATDFGAFRATFGSARVMGKKSTTGDGVLTALKLAARSSSDAARSGRGSRPGSASGRTGCRRAG